MNFYLVKSSDNKYYRSKGYGGYGKNWVDTPEKAKIYSTEGRARTVVSWWATNCPEYPPATIIKFAAEQVEEIIVDLNAIKKRKLKRELANKKRYLKHTDATNTYGMNILAKEIQDIEKEIESLK